MDLVNNIRQKEETQSHTLIYFNYGLPYCELGWEKYRKFNSKITDTIKKFSIEQAKEVYLHEHETLVYDRQFVWCFSFFESTPAIRDTLSKSLRDRIQIILWQFNELKDVQITNNHDEDFEIHPNLGIYYYHLIDNAEFELQPYPPPQIKTYKKENLDLGVLEEKINVLEFKKVVQEQLRLSSAEDMAYLTALDGFNSNKYRANKYLREEFIPLVHYINRFKIPESSIIKLGLNQNNFDAQIEHNNETTTIECTLACPENDHNLFSLMEQSSHGYLPLKNLSKLKLETESIPKRIIRAIEKKHKKNYDDQRILIVIIQSEYTYQMEEYIISEIIKEVRATNKSGIGKFQKILLLCGSKFYPLY